jgi:hypothetical protein
MMLITRNINLKFLLLVTIFCFYFLLTIKYDIIVRSSSSSDKQIQQALPNDYNLKKTFFFNSTKKIFCLILTQPKNLNTKVEKTLRL